MALRLHWVPILPSTFSTDKHSPSLILQHKPSSANPFSVSSLFFSNSSISTVSAIPSSTRSRKCRNLAFQISSLAEEQTDSTTTTIDTPDTTTSTTTTIETPDTTTSEVKDPLKLLAQNIPWSYTATDIRKLFEKHGTVVNVEMSMHNGTRNRGLAFVTMGSEEEAVAALTNLESYEVEGRAIRMAYAFKRKKKIANRPVYPVPSKLKIFVDNLAWNVTTEDLKEFFRSANPVSAEVILERTEPRRSSGYGFVSFGSKEEAAAAISEFKGQPLKGRPIRMELSGRTPKGAVQKVYKRPAQRVETSAEINVGELEPAQPAETSTEMNVGELEPAQPVETSTEMNAGELSQNVV